ALHNYYAAYKKLPAQRAGTTGAMGYNVAGNNGDRNNLQNRHRLSFLVGLTPFFEQQAIWEQVSQPYQFFWRRNQLNPLPDDRGFAGPWSAMGPVPWQLRYPAWRTSISTLQCPSDSGPSVGGSGTANYAGSLGDVTWGLNWRNPRIEIQRGVFLGARLTKLSEILDGTANTIAMAEISNDTGGRDVRGNTAFDTHGAREIAADPSLCAGTRDPARPTFYDPQYRLFGYDKWGNARRGNRWADGGTNFTSINTILPPNSPSCAAGGGDAGNGIWTASSYHIGGCHVLMADASVQFITEQIEAGDASIPPVGRDHQNWPVHSQAGIESPYGLWGALGTRNGRETDQLDQG
ncbi:MAG: DUF1559 domain-containing protein, partial [Planctomycetota bacterium]